MGKTFRADAVAEKHRVEHWKALCREIMGSVEIVPDRGAPFDAAFTVTDVGQLSVVAYRGTPQTHVRSDALIRSSDPDHYNFLLQRSGQWRCEHGTGTRAGLSGLTLFDVTRPFTVRHVEDVDVINVCVPRRALETRLPAATRLAGVSVEPGSDLFPAVSSFMESLTRLNADRSAALRDRLSALGIELLAAAFSEADAAGEAGRSGPYIVARAKSFIDRNLDVQGLDQAQVAQALGISVRRLQEVALEEQISLHEWMWGRRIARARALLGARGRTCAIGQVSDACGFRSQAHFTRRFRAETGMSPREFRGQAAARGAELPGPAAPPRR